MKIKASEFWDRVAWGRPDAPIRQLCAFCAGKLPGVPLMLSMEDGHAASFCDRCADLVIKFTRVVDR